MEGPNVDAIDNLVEVTAGDDDAKPEYGMNNTIKPEYGMNYTMKPEHGMNYTTKPEHEMHDKPMNHSDDDLWYPEDEYPYASSTPITALSISTLILTMINK